MEFLQYNRKWVDFISQSRIDGKETNYDIIYDRMADTNGSKITDILKEYVDYEITAGEVVKRIQWHNDCNDQFCFKSKRSLNILKMQKIFIQYKDKDKDKDKDEDEDEDGKWKVEIEKG